MRATHDNAAKPSERFRPRERLKTARDFERVYKLRQRVSDRVLTVYVEENGLAWSRLGISVSRRVGGAVQRNYVKRRIREAFRRGKSRIPIGIDLVCVAQTPAGDRKVDIAASLESLVKKATERFLTPRRAEYRKG